MKSVHPALSEISRRGLRVCPSVPQGGLNLLPSLEFRRNQTHLLYSGATHDVNGVGHLRENDGVITLDESDFLGSQLENIVEPGPQSVPGSIVFVNFQHVVVQHLN